MYASQSENPKYITHEKRDIEIFPIKLDYLKLTLLHSKH